MYVCMYNCFLKDNWYFGKIPCSVIVIDCPISIDKLQYFSINRHHTKNVILMRHAGVTHESCVGQESSIQIANLPCLLGCV